jgi:chromosome segregation ATPase
MQIADLRIDLDTNQRERVARAADLERLAVRASALEDRLREAEQRAANLARELDAVWSERAEERGELVRAREQVRELAATARAASAEGERLAAECGRWMTRAAALEDDLRAAQPSGRRPRSGRT